MLGTLSSEGIGRPDACPTIVLGGRPYNVAIEASLQSVKLA